MPEISKFGVADAIGMMAIVLAPFLFGSVVPESQGVVGLMSSVALCIAMSLSHSGLPSLTAKRLVLVLSLIIIPLFPIPSWGWKLSPDHAKTAMLFSSDLPSEIGKNWVNSSLTPGTVLDRALVLLIGLVFFILGRSGVRRRGWVNWFTFAVATALILLCSHAVWMRLNRSDVVFGLWKIPWGTGAGCFANRNFFALWCYMGSFVTLAGVIRSVAPLRSMRTGMNQAPVNSGRAMTGWYCLATLCGIGSAIGTGSRGAFLAFCGAMLFWFVILLRRSISVRRTFILALLASLLLAVFCALAAFLMSRFANMASSGSGVMPKIGIWKEALTLWLKNPFLGIGWGAFQWVVNYSKSTGAGVSFLHVENDYIETLVEGGLVGFGAFCLIGFRYVASPVVELIRGRGGYVEPELAIGAAAATLALLFHAFVDFPMQIPSVLWFGALLVGVINGSLPRPEQSCQPAVVVPGIVLCALVALGAFSQLSAFLHWQDSRKTVLIGPRINSLEKSLFWWPWNGHRTVAWIRLESARISLLPAKQRVDAWKKSRERVRRFLFWNRMDWEVRLELMAFDSRFSGDTGELSKSAELLLQLNPLHPRLPFELARMLADQHPTLALRFLKGSAGYDPLLPELLELAFKLEGTPEKLWGYIEPRSEPLRRMAEFALKHGFRGMASEALGLMQGGEPPAWLGGMYLELGMPERAISVLGSEIKGEVLHLRARALLALGRDFEAVELYAGTFSREARPPGRLYFDINTDGSRTSNPAGAFAEWEKSRKDRDKAWRAAVDLWGGDHTADTLLKYRMMTAAFPEDPRFLYRSFLLERKLGEFRKAIETGGRLARILDL